MYVAMTKLGGLYKLNSVSICLTSTLHCLLIVIYSHDSCSRSMYSTFCFYPIVILMFCWVFGRAAHTGRCVPPLPPPSQLYTLFYRIIQRKFPVLGVKKNPRNNKAVFPIYSNRYIHRQAYSYVYGICTVQMYMCVIALHSLLHSSNKSLFQKF
jgi:hypothetical protein